jgi:hypothetical protein
MDNFTVFPNQRISSSGIVSRKFLDLEIADFIDACKYIHHLPYGYNSDRDDLMILFKEGMGSCTTKHAVIGTLAQELGLPIAKKIGIYPMTEKIVTGTDSILGRYNLPYLPMVHCFLEYDNHWIDLTEGNQNGKNQSIDNFLYTQTVTPNISAKEEYLLYRKVLTDRILSEDELPGAQLKQVLQAREEGLELLKSKV